jgi:hypothetical protein
VAGQDRGRFVCPAAVHGDGVGEAERRLAAEELRVLVLQLEVGQFLEVLDERDEVHEVVPGPCVLDRGCVVEDVGGIGDVGDAVRFA